MRRFTFIAAVITLLVIGCAPATELPVTAITATDTVMPLPTSTNTPLSTATKRPSATPNIPTLTITPMVVAPVSAGPLTLTEFNAGTEMKRLNVIGTGTPHDIKFSPDGKRLAVATGRGVYLYDGKEIEPNGFIDVNDSVSNIAFSPDGNVLALAIGGKVSLWNVASGQNILNLDGELVYIFKLIYGRGGFVAVMGSNCQGCGSSQQMMILWDARTGRQIFSQKDIWYSTKALVFTSDGKKLIFGGNDGINVIDSETGRQVAVYKSVSPFDIILDINETRLFVTSLDGDSEIFDMTTQTNQPFTLCGIYLTSNDVNGACSSDQKILLFDLSSGIETKKIDVGIDLGQWNSIFILNPDNRFLVYFDKSVMNIFDLQTNQIIKSIGFTDFDNALSGIVNIDDVEKYAVATLTYSGQVEIFDIQTGDLIRMLKLDCCEIKGFGFAPDQKIFATVDKNILRLWNLQTGNIVYEVDLKENFSGPIAFSPDGSSVFLTHIAEDYVIEFDLQSGKSINQGHNSYAYDFADPFALENYHFNDLGNLMMFGYEKNDEKHQPSFQDVKTKEKIVLPVDLKIDPDFIEAFSFSPDGQYLAYGNPTDIFVWNTKTLKLQSKLTGHMSRGADGWYGKIRALVFNPQSDLLVSVGWDDTIRLWNARFGTELRRLNVCCSVDFTPDGRYLITYGDGVALVWGILK